MNPEKIPLNPIPLGHEDLSPYQETLEAPVVSPDLLPRRRGLTAMQLAPGKVPKMLVVSDVIFW